MPSLNEIRFRSSAFVELKELGDLTAEQREPFLALQSDPDFYGLLVPRPPLMMNLMSVARQTAELFQSLATPSRLNDGVLGDDELAGNVIDLVLDGILEIETSGGFVSGADALPLLSCPPVMPGVHNAASRLSREALLHAQDLETRDPHALASTLYLYNRIPLAPFWERRFANPRAILAHLGADRGALGALLEREWIASRRMPGFLAWSSRQSTLRNGDGLTYKLYISPRPERIRDAFEVVVRVLSAFPGTTFKIGNNAVGLLRPDKLMAYFRNGDELGEVAEVLGRELDGVEAQGVPFTAGLDDSGLLAWGVDPPDSDRVLRWLGRESWRNWVVKRLGAALSVAKAASSAEAIEPWRFAMERARRHGVDVETWIPSPTLWNAS